MSKYLAILLCFCVSSCAGHTLGCITKWYGRQNPKADSASIGQWVVFFFIYRNFANFHETCSGHKVLQLTMNLLSLVHVNKSETEKDSQGVSPLALTLSICVVFDSKIAEF